MRSNFDWNGLGCGAMGALLMALIMMWGSFNHKERIAALETELNIERRALEHQTRTVDRYEIILSKVFSTWDLESFATARVYSTPVTVTAYSARPEETNSEPWFTADMSLSRVGMLAVSRDILSELGLEYGETVILEGFGVFRVRDTMNSRWRRRVDILMAHPEAALRFGKKEAMLTWLRDSQ